MYVDDVSFKGFLSFHNSSGFHELSPNVNTLVGHNGAGKSNSLAAIRYVIDGLPEKSLNDLSFNGRGRPASECWVKVVSKDIGNRFPQYEDEISLTRKLEHGREKFQINKKYVSKREFSSLLESAGLTADGNAFFIVPQGRVTELATLSDEDRLNVSSEVCGSKSFERRKLDAEKSFEKKTSAVNQMCEVIDSLNDRLKHISQEAEDLRVHSDLRKESRGIQHIQLSIERKRTQEVSDIEDEKLKSQQNELKQIFQKLNQCESDLLNRREAVTDADGKLQEHRAECQIAERQAASARAQLRRMANKDATGQDESLAMTLQTPPQRFMTQESPVDIANPDSINDDDDENEYLFRPIDSHEVEEIDHRLSIIREQLQSKSDLAAHVGAQIRKLMLKRGRARQLSSEEIAKNRESSLAACDSTLAEIQLVIESETKESEQLQDTITTAELKCAEAREASNEANKGKNYAESDERKLREQLNSAESSRNEAILSLRRAEIKVEKLEKKAEQLAKRIMVFSQTSVVSGVRQIRQCISKLDLNPSQYFGTVADLIDVQPAFAYALDRYAGSEMFYHVVDSSETVETIVDALKSSNSGMVYGSAVFIPLADVIVPPAPVISDSEFDSEMMTRLTDVVSVRDARFQNVIRLLFNKCFICREFNKDSFHFAKRHNVTLVSIEGDICDPRGAISGGSNTDFIASQAGMNSRISLIRSLGSIYDDISLQKADAVTQRALAERTAQQVTQCGDQLNQAHMVTEHRSEVAADRLATCTALCSSLKNLKSKHTSLICDIDLNKTKLKDCEEERQCIANEQSFSGELTALEISQLKELTIEEQQLMQDCTALEKEEFEWTQKCSKIHRAFAHQQAAAEKVREIEMMSHRSEEDRERFHRAQEAFAAAQGDVQKFRNEIMIAENELTKLQEQLDSAEEKKIEIETESNRVHKKVESQSRKVDSIKKLLADFDSKSASLGSIPEAALIEAREMTENESNLTSQELASKANSSTSRHTAIERRIAELGDVNMQAINDHERYTAMLAKHQAEYEDLVRERSTLENSFNQLDAEKSSQVQRMSERVSINFESIFAGSTGQPTGKLRIVHDNNNKITSVRFDVPYGTDANSFSSGQKTVCSLALVFAAQACQSAPFYVFDEIDANSDEATRTRLAAIIKESSHKNGIQFISTTFNEELATIGDKFYRVRAGFNSTHVKETTKEETLAILNGAVAIDTGALHTVEAH